MYQEKINKDLFLIFHGRLPSDKAASLFAVKSAEAFADQGLKVTLLVPRRKGVTNEDPYNYYNVERSFSIVYIDIVDLFRVPALGFISFWLSYASFSRGIRSYLRKNSATGDIIYSNEILPLAQVSSFRKNCFYEMHDFPESKLVLFGMALKKMKWVLIHNKWKMAEAKKVFNIPEAKILYEPNAVDIKAFDLSLSKKDARTKLGLSLSKKLAVYTGHLYGWKGVDTLALASGYLPEDCMVIFVGGTREDVEKFKNKYGNQKNISILGHVGHSQIPIWQKAADVLVLPNTAKEKISAFYTSPMKLFEYMASGRPIVATDIPSVREILSEKNAVIVTPDDPQALAHGIVTAIGDVSLAEKLSAQALHDVADHTWVKRAERIIKFTEI